MKVRLDKYTSITGVHVVPQTSGNKVEKLLKNIHKGDECKVIVAGDINDRHKTWDKISNPRGTVVVQLSTRRNYIITQRE